VETDLRTGESIALPVSMLVMVVVFGGFLAAGMPIAGALASIAGALASLLGFSYLIDLDASVVNVVTVLGLGLCIDYGLLIVSRFREELRREPDDVERALVATMRTAGRTIVYSAVTVAISLSGLLVFSADILRAVGAAGVSVVLVALVVALTLVPTLLALAGGRMVRPGVPHRVPGLRRLVRRLGDVAPPEGFFSRLGRAVQRSPALPALDMQLRSSGTELLPVDADQRVFFSTLAEEFPATASPAVRVVADAEVTEVSAWSQQVADIEGVQAVEPPVAVGDYTVLGVRVADPDPNSQVATDVVGALRSDRPEAPWAIGVVVLATFALLFAMTGSLLVPLKALLLNVVSLGASLGVVVWVFQYGHLEDVLDFTSAGGVETIIPPLVLAFGFGLAMDYEVFLLARIAEMRAAGLTNDEAVVAGLQRSGRIITSAALIVVIVFSGFVAGELLVIKQNGVALAVAVAVDATLVRCLLVPATMTLLGEWNWWAPAPLRRLHDRLGLAH
jgi:RND superfamily putative drug exporter